MEIIGFVSHRNQYINRLRPSHQCRVRHPRILTQKDSIFPSGSQMEHDFDVNMPGKIFRERYCIHGCIQGNDQIETHIHTFFPKRITLNQEKKKTQNLVIIILLDRHFFPPKKGKVCAHSTIPIPHFVKLYCVMLLYPKKERRRLTLKLYNTDQQKLITQMTKINSKGKHEYEQSWFIFCIKLWLTLHLKDPMSVTYILARPLLISQHTSEIEPIRKNIRFNQRKMPICTTLFGADVE